MDQSKIIDTFDTYQWPEHWKKSSHLRTRFHPDHFFFASDCGNEVVYLHRFNSFSYHFCLVKPSIPFPFPAISLSFP